MILNLAYPEKSQIKFTVSKFPDGQQSITLNTHYIQPNEPITIKSRLNSFQDLELIICANQAIKSLGTITLVNLYVPYFLGARSDRQFDYKGVNYLKQVICPIINNQNFNSVTVIDPHSDVLEACLNNFDKYNNFALVKFALEKIDNKDGAQDRICLISPDAGAYKKVFDVAKEFKINNIITATKVRDLKTGQIIKTEIPNLPISTTEEDLNYVIIDDICDGGRTFIELAKVIKDSRPTAEIYLVVTHGIFSAGLYELSKHVDGIFTTNSVKDIDAESSSSIFFKDYLKQLNVF
jgi:ribose-phosphate pyrophosphokinase